MAYATQREAARRAIVTPQMRQVLESEAIETDALLAAMAAGRIVIPANTTHRSLVAAGIGDGLRTKVNVNLGASADCCHHDMEMAKVNAAVAMKADAIMDLSTSGDIRGFRRRLLDTCPLMIGTVPVYDLAAAPGQRVSEIRVDDFFHCVETHAEDGVDFITIHAGLTRSSLDALLRRPRLTHVVSRGGSLMLEWMHATGMENPFYEHFDRLLDICRRYDVTLSLGDGLRPGSIHDATDTPQIQELLILGELTLQAWDADVQVIIEGPGHVPLNEIAANMLIQKKICHGAPFYVLGPLVTDVAPGYDHITAAIGGALAAAHGAAFLCYVTPAEHLRLPDLDDMKEGIIAARIAAHAADVAKGLPGAADWDHAMSRARRDLDWPKMYDLAIDPEKARRYRESVAPSDETVCSMCGDLCAVKRSRRVFETTP
ncbi:MAG: phosphomethylpyrimidine synthase ThiC [Pseudomonadota bacterium]